MARYKFIGDNRIESVHWAVEFVDLDEGWHGEYNPDNPEDEPLLRFDMYSRENSKREWREPYDSSYCTQINADKVTKAQKRKLLVHLLNQVIDLQSDEPVKKLCERLSWIEIGWVKK